MRWALYVTFPPAWLDPAEVAVAGVTPFWIIYALHDALLKPMPGNPMAPSLAESWTVSHDQKVYEFKLREGPHLSMVTRSRRRTSNLVFCATNGQTAEIRWRD